MRRHQIRLQTLLVNAIPPISISGHVEPIQICLVGLESPISICPPVFISIPPVVVAFPILIAPVVILFPTLTVAFYNKHGGPCDSSNGNDQRK